MFDLSLLGPDRIRPLKRSEYDRLVEMGAFEDEPVELLDGILVYMSPQGAPHREAVKRLAKLMTIALGWILEVEGRAIGVCRDPSPTGYRSVSRHGPADTIAPQAFPDVQVRVGDIMPG